MGLITVLLAILATVRVTRLVTHDAISDPVRLWITDRFGANSKIAYFVHCPWCVSMYVGAVAGYSAWSWADTPGYQVATLALSASYVAGYLVSRED